MRAITDVAGFCGKAGCGYDETVYKLDAHIYELDSTIPPRYESQVAAPLQCALAGTGIQGIRSSNLEAGIRS